MSNTMQKVNVEVQKLQNQSQELYKIGEGLAERNKQLETVNTHLVAKAGNYQLVIKKLQEENARLSQLVDSLRKEQVAQANKSFERAKRRQRHSKQISSEKHRRRVSFSKDTKPR